MVLSWVCRVEISEFEFVIVCRSNERGYEGQAEISQDQQVPGFSTLTAFLVLLIHCPALPWYLGRNGTLAHTQP